MALRGNLRDFSLPDVFSLVTLSKKTGVLRIRRSDGAEGSVWFRDGDVFFAQSNWHHEPLGERLVEGGKITPAALARGLEAQRGEPAGGRRLGQILVDEGFITGSVLETFVQEQIQDTIFDLMRWDDGDFDFKALESADEEDIGLTVSIENVIMEGARRLEEWNRVKKKVPSMDMVFKMATAPGEGTFEISLKPIEWNLLLLIDGTRSVAELARETRRTDFDVARVVYGLFSAGLLEVASDEEVERLRGERAEREARLSAAPVPAPAPVAPTAAPAQPAPAAPAPAPAPPAPVAAPIPSPAGVVPPVPAEEPEFLSAGKHAPSADDVAVFEQMMGVLEAPLPAPAASAPTSEPVPPVPTPAPVAPTPAPEPIAPAPAPAPVAPGPEPAPVAEESPFLEPILPEQEFPVPPAAEVPPVAPVFEPETAVPTEIPAGTATVEEWVPIGETPPPAPAWEPAAEEAPAPVFEPMSERPEASSLTGFAESAAAAPLSDELLYGYGEPVEPEVELPPAPVAEEPVEFEVGTDLSGLLASLEEEEAAEPRGAESFGAELPPPPPAGVLHTETIDEPASGVGGVISTDAFLAEFDEPVDVGFASGIGDELTALTGGTVPPRGRPTASVNRIPEESAAGERLHRDRSVDRDLVNRIIQGIERL